MTEKTYEQKLTAIQKDMLREVMHPLEDLPLALMPNRQPDQWKPLSLPSPSRIERLIGKRKYTKALRFVKSIPYWKLRPCNEGCFLTCKGHTGVSA